MKRSEEAVAKNENTIKVKNRFLGKYDISPCPFCGEADNLAIEQSLYFEEKFLCKCRNCLAATGMADSPDEALALWDAKKFPYEVWITAKDQPYTKNHDVWLDLKNAIVFNEFNIYKKDLERVYIIRDCHSNRLWSYLKYKAAKTKADLSGTYFKWNKMQWLTEIPRNVFIDTANKQARYNVVFRKFHKCYSCQRNSCIHRQENLWRVWEPGNEYDKCKKEAAT